MRYKKCIRNQDAVAGVIEALLLVALVAVVLSMIQLTYIPQVMEQQEAAHMDEVLNQFSYLKSMIDIQTITRSDVPMFSMITLGSRELPYFITARAFGTLTIPQNACTITLSNNGSGSTSFVVGAIKYEAQNSYLTDQNYVIYNLECGGIVRKQPTGEPVMLVDPSIAVKDSGSYVDINFSATNIINISGKDYSPDFGKCFIRTNFSVDGSFSQNFLDVLSINITTPYPNAWFECFDRTFNTSLVTQKIVVNLSKGPNYAKITFAGKSQNKVRLNVAILRVYAQIGPGWVV